MSGDVSHSHLYTTYLRVYQIFVGDFTLTWRKMNLGSKEIIGDVLGDRGCQTEGGSCDSGSDNSLRPRRPVTGFRCDVSGVDPATRENAMCTYIWDI